MERVKSDSRKKGKVIKKKEKIGGVPKATGLGIHISLSQIMRYPIELI